MNLIDSPYKLPSGNVSLAYDLDLAPPRGGFRFRDGYEILDDAPDQIDHMRAWYLEGLRLLAVSAHNIAYLWRPPRLELEGEEIVEHPGEFIPIPEAEGAGDEIWCFEQFEKAFGGTIADALWMCGSGNKGFKVRADGLTLPLVESTEWKNMPEDARFCRAWKNRMIVVGSKFPQRLFFSEIADPEMPEGMANGGYGENWIDIKTSEDDLDPITWLEVLDDALIVFKSRSVNVITDDATFSFDRIANVGCAGRFQSCVIDDRCYFLNRNGIYSVTTAGELRLESQNIEPIFLGETSGQYGEVTFNRMSSLEKARLCSDRRGRLYFSVEDEESLHNEPNTIWEGYPRNRGLADSRNPRTPWVRHRFSELEPRSMCVFRESDSNADGLLCGTANPAGGTPAHLALLFSGDTDGIQPLNSGILVTGWEGLLTEEPFERIRRLSTKMMGRAILRVESDEQSFSKAVSTPENGAKEDFIGIRPETWGRYHRVTFSRSSAPYVPTQFFNAEFALRGGKEHKA